MALHLPRTFILLHPYNGYILGIFLDVHVISLIQAQCTTALTGPQLQIILFGLIHEDYVACRLLLADVGDGSEVFFVLLLRLAKLLVESVSGTDRHYNSNEQAHNSSSEYSLSIQCPPSMNITWGIYRWRYTSHVQLLFYTLTTVIFLEYSWTYT